MRIPCVEHIVGVFEDPAPLTNSDPERWPRRIRRTYMVFQRLKVIGVLGFRRETFRRCVKFDHVAKAFVGKILLLKCRAENRHHTEICVKAVGVVLVVELGRCSGIKVANE